MLNVAVLGLGTMGDGIARNVLKAGFPLTVYNRTRARSDALVALGATAAATPREAAGSADVVIAMVADDPASRAVWLGPDGALDAARAGSVLVECSTLSLDWVRDLAGRAAARGVAFLDSPVTGSRPQAAEGQLGLLVGGDAAALERARPVLQSISRFIAHLGPTGSGALMKLINNMLGAVQAASLAEGLVIAERAGMNVGQVAELLTNGAPGSGMVKSKIGQMVSGDYADVNFALRLICKDVTYALRAADEYGVTTPTAASAREMYKLADGLGFGGSDVAAVVESYRLSAKKPEPAAS